MNRLGHVSRTRHIGETCATMRSTYVPLKFTFCVSYAGPLAITVYFLNISRCSCLKGVCHRKLFVSLNPLPNRYSLEKVGKASCTKLLRTTG